MELNLFALFVGLTISLSFTIFPIKKIYLLLTKRVSKFLCDQRPENDLVTPFFRLTKNCQFYLNRLI